jgi:hypothetical protein
MQLGEAMLVETQLSTTIPDGNVSSERCLALNHDSAGLTTTLKRVDCLGQNKNFICQVSSNWTVSVQIKKSFNLAYVQRSYMSNILHEKCKPFQNN